MTYVAEQKIAHAAAAYQTIYAEENHISLFNVKLLARINDR